MSARLRLVLRAGVVQWLLPPAMLPMMSIALTLV
jgi:hypothetical protein